MSQSGIYSSGGSGGSGIQNIFTDSGTGASGSNITLKTDYAGPSSNGTAQFSSSGSAIVLSFNDGTNNLTLGATIRNGSPGGSDNTAIGTAAMGDNGFTGNNNTAIGASAFESISTASDSVGIGYSAGNLQTSGNRNVLIGSEAGGEFGPITGSYNIEIGYQAGHSYQSSESSNVLLNASSTSVTAESNVLRIGNGTGTGNQQLAAAYISGINGVNVGSVASVVAINGDHLGSTVLTAGSGITITPAANTITIAATGGGSGSFVLIQTQTATSQTSLTFTTGITNTYNKYKILFDNVVTATTTNLVLAQISTNGGSSYISTNYFTAGNTSVAGLVVVSMESNGGDAGFTYGDTDLYNLTSGSNYVTASTVASVFYDTTSPGATTPPLAVSAYTVVSTTVNALQIVTDDSTAFSGTFSLYGITM